VLLTSAKGKVLPHENDRVPSYLLRGYGILLSKKTRFLDALRAETTTQFYLVICFKSALKKRTKRSCFCFVNAAIRQQKTQPGAAVPHKSRKQNKEVNKHNGQRPVLQAPNAP
jgi:hypothetical protein